METEGVGFTEAVERLAAMAGMPLPAATPDAARHEQRRKTLYDVMELAAKFFADTLASRHGARARGYLADRAISPAVQLQFRIGYAPAERFALKEYLGAQGIPVEDMVEAGLLVAGDDIPVPYDRVPRPRDVSDHRSAQPRHRLRRPRAGKGRRGEIHELAGNAAVSQGRQSLQPRAARQAAHNGSPLVVVEGYVDVIAMVGAGFAATVAPLGTALTENQLALLWKMADEPILCFDGDKAGQKAAWRAADLALPQLKPGKSLRFALLPEGQDPDDLARSGGRLAIEEVIGAARGLADVIWSREIEGGSFATPERRAALEARIGELTNGIRDEVVRRYYRQDLAERLQRTFAPEGGAAAMARAISGGGRAANQARDSAGRAASFTPGAAGRFESRGRGRSPRRAARPSTAAPTRPPAPSSL